MEPPALRVPGGSTRRKATRSWNDLPASRGAIDESEQVRVKGPLAPAPLLVEPNAEQFPRPIVVRSQDGHHRSSGPEDHLVTGLWFLNAHKPFSRCANLQISGSGRERVGTAVGFVHSSG
jgi:hypothetical protein